MLKLEHVSFIVDDEGKDRAIINDLCLEIPDGKFIVITGPNGGGKSTLAKLIMGIYTVTSGKIYFNDVDITDMSVTDRAKMGIGFAFQQPPRFKGLTVRDLLGLAYGSELPEDKCCEFLTQVGLCSKDYLNRQVDASLSGGEVKRIEIATVMARKLKLSVYDEPEAGIDLWSFSMLIDTFKKIRVEEDQTLMIISHQERIINLADEIIIIREGKVAARGTKEEVLPLLSMQAEQEACTLK